MINGIINVYKEQGFTSFDVVAKLRGILAQKKIGHTGTLDPDAVGVLPVCLGNGTKLVDLLTDKHKEYIAEMQLGVETDTLDLSGTILRTLPVEVTEEEVKRVIHSFVGTYDQIPPMYSAIKVNGQKLVDLAREGIVVERKARTVTIEEIEILSIDLPVVKMRVACSKGTYIRSLCADIGEKCGTVAAMKSLVRSKVDFFTIEDAKTLDEIAELKKKNELESYIVTVDQVLSNLPKVHVKGKYQKVLQNGNRLKQYQLLDLITEKTEGAEYLVYDEQDVFYGVFGYVEETEQLKPVKMFLPE